MKKIAVLVLCLAFLYARDASAHHSFAMFDGSKTVIIEGTVKSWEWKSPHAWLTVDVMDAKTHKGVYKTNWQVQIKAKPAVSGDGKTHYIDGSLSPAGAKVEASEALLPF